MATPHAIPIALSGTDRDLLQGWVRRRKPTSQQFQQRNALQCRAGDWSGPLVLVPNEPSTESTGVMWP